MFGVIVLALELVNVLGTLVEVVGKASNVIVVLVMTLLENFKHLLFLLEFSLLCLEFQVGNGVVQSRRSGDRRLWWRPIP